MKSIVIDGVTVPIGTHAGKEIFIGSDHRGYNHKQYVIRRLEGNYKVTDCGTFTPTRCDYPPISFRIGEEVFVNPYERVGIGICGSGSGIIIPASKFLEVYPVTCNRLDAVASTRRHNNSNVLGIGADFTSTEEAMEIINLWLTTPFDPEEPYLSRYVQTLKLEREAFRKNLRKLYGQDAQKLIRKP